MPNGITYNRNAAGKPTSVTISLKKHGADLQDFLDSAEIKKRSSEPATPLRSVISRLDKKNGVKRS